MPWQDTLQPASWRGVPFGWDGGDGRAGRNTAVHPYPFREDNPAWVEDLGLAPRAHRIVGWLLGDDYIAQLEEMLGAVEQPGQGELVHPLLGSMVGSVVGFQHAFRKDRGRVIELVFEFLENDPGAPYPTTQADTKANVMDAAAAGQAGIAKDFDANTGRTTHSQLNTGGGAP